jgi:alkylhydroperoxidase family enzyme
LNASLLGDCLTFAKLGDGETTKMEQAIRQTLSLGVIDTCAEPTGSQGKKGNQELLENMKTSLNPFSGLIMNLEYYFTRRQFGTVLTPLEVHSARLPAAFGLFYSKVSKLDQKLTLPPELVMLIRHQVARINTCLFCIDIARAFTIKASMNQAKFDALDQYTTSPLFTDAERAALDYVTELTKDKQVSPDTFSRMARRYSEREICEIVWLVASEHLYNITNIGLNIHSDMLCDITKKTRNSAERPQVGDREREELKRWDAAI